MHIVHKVSSFRANINSLSSEPRSKQRICTTWPECLYIVMMKASPSPVVSMSRTRQKKKWIRLGNVGFFRTCGKQQLRKTREDARGKTISIFYCPKVDKWDESLYFFVNITILCYLYLENGCKWEEQRKFSKLALFFYLDKRHKTKTVKPCLINVEFAFTKLNLTVKMLLSV